jgi:hypothetical protein
MIARFQDAKNLLTLLNRLIRLAPFKPILSLRSHERQQKLMDAVQKTLRAISSEATSGQMQKQIEGVSQQPERVRFVYLSNVLELLYKSLLLFLVYQQTIISKKSKCDFRIRDLQKKGADGQGLGGEKYSLNSLRQKQ